MIEAFVATHATSSVMRFVLAWGTEEIGLIGSHRYAVAHADELPNVRLFKHGLCRCKGRKGCSTRVARARTFFERLFNRWQRIFR